MPLACSLAGGDGHHARSRQGDERKHPRMPQVLTCGNSPIFSMAACSQGSFQGVTARISCRNERKLPSGLQRRQPPLSRLGHFGYIAEAVAMATWDSVPDKCRVCGRGRRRRHPLHRLALTSSRTQTGVTPSAPLWWHRAASACPPGASTGRPGSRRCAGPCPGNPRRPQSHRIPLSPG